MSGKPFLLRHSLSFAFGIVFPRLLLPMAPKGKRKSGQSADSKAKAAKTASDAGVSKAEWVQKLTAWPFACISLHQQSLHLHFDLYLYLLPLLRFDQTVLPNGGPDTYLTSKYGDED